MDADGNLYVVDNFNQRILSRDPNGNWSVLSDKGAVGLAVGGDGSLYVTNGSLGLRKRDLAGVWTVLAPRGSETGQVREALGVAVDAIGNLYVADPGNQRIQRFGAPLPQFQPGDVNRDGSRDVSDAVLILRIIVDTFQPDAEQRTLSNVNGDAGTDVLDAVTLLRILVGL